MPSNTGLARRLYRLFETAPRDRNLLIARWPAVPTGEPAGAILSAATAKCIAKEANSSE